MRLRGCYRSSREKHDHVAKVFVIHEERLFLMQQPQLQGGSREKCQYSVIRGSFSPQARLGQSGTAETIAEILRRSLVVPKYAGKIALQCWRLVDTDENKANLRAEKSATTGSQSHVPQKKPIRI